MIRVSGNQARRDIETPPRGRSSGEVESLQAFPGKAGEATRVRARVAFVGARANLGLSLVASDGERVVQVSCLANAAQPSMGLGVFPVDSTSRIVYDVEGELKLPGPGTYRFEGLSGEDGRLTALATVVVP